MMMMMIVVVVVAAVVMMMMVMMMMMMMRGAIASQSECALADTSPGNAESVEAEGPSRVEWSR